MNSCKYVHIIVIMK